MLLILTAQDAINVVKKRSGIVMTLMELAEKNSKVAKVLRGVME